MRCASLFVIALSLSCCSVIAEFGDGDLDKFVSALEKAPTKTVAIIVAELAKGGEPMKTLIAAAVKENLATDIVAALEKDNNLLKRLDEAINGAALRG
ncbi:hypothetical protein ACLKA7_007027 [Drosophila subpalustris]